MKTVTVFLFVFLAPLAIAGRATPAFATSDASGAIINLNVQNCNNNGICEPQYGENYPACPLDCSPGGISVNPPRHPSTIGVLKPQFFDSEIIPESIRIIYTERGTVIIDWQTQGLALENLSWGKTVDTELGSISEINYLQFHSFEIFNLSPGTLYFYSIESTDRYGHRSYLNDQYFITPAIKIIPTPSPTETAIPTFTSLPPSPVIERPLPLSIPTGFNCGRFTLYCADYYIAYFFGFINYLTWLFLGL